MNEQNHRAKLEVYKQDSLQLLKQLDRDVWRAIHSSLRRDAALLDRNSELYLLLRVSTWEARTKITGRISGGLWLRYIAEVIRRGFEDASSERWPEEDLEIDTWNPRARRRAFGSERPLDDEFRSKPYLAYRFGLFTGSAVRWYVEGDTEFYAVDEILPESSKAGIELVNLKGAIKSGKANAALRLNEMLQQDRASRRFSIISFDLDVEENVKAIRQLAKEDRIVGAVASNEPDFELANFTVSELAEVAARIDEAHGFSGAAVRAADWTGINSADAFKDRYLKISERKPGTLKGEEWGRALATFAMEHQRRSDGAERPLWLEISAALYSWNSNYDFEEKHSKLDPESFKRVVR